jgi:hypothetical protein
VSVFLQRAEEEHEALQLAIRYIETAKTDLWQFFRNMSPAVSKDEFCYRIQEIIKVLDVGVEEA